MLVLSSSMIFCALFLPRATQALCLYCNHPGPVSPSDQPAWLAGIQQDRNTTLDTIKYKGGNFATPGLAWTQTAYIQPQMHPYDRYFYDPVKKEYTVDRFLDDLETRYGGVDAILMWPTYTNIGADDRNQFDLFRAMPGGLDAVRNVTEQLHKRGVHVLWPYNPWDTGTRREPLDDEHTFAKLLKQTGGDGFNGDTMGFVPESFWTAATEADYPLAFEPEGGGTDEALNWSTMGWGYWPYTKIPVIDRFKFITKGKFMTNVCDRWAQRKTDNLQSAWLSGTGYESWENVWGTWNGIVERDGEAIRRVASMLRFFGGKINSTAFPLAARDYLHSPDWEPHAPGPMNVNVFASRFPLKADGGKSSLYTMVNRGGLNLTGQQLWIRGPLPDGAKLYDCYHGTELKPEKPVAPPPVPKPTIPKGYNLYRSLNSFTGHGGEDIDENPVSGLTVEQCVARCDADNNCSCVTFEASGGNCWKRAACEPEGFAAGAEYDVYKKARGYTLWAGQNCYTGHGGVEIDVNPILNLTVQQCQARCDADTNCSCVTYQASSEKCWRRAQCVPNFFEASKFDTYVKESSQPRCTSGCDPSPTPPPKDSVAVSFDFEVDGFGCVLQTAGPASSEISKFLSSMKDMTRVPLYSIDATWKYLEQTRVPIEKTKVQSSAPAGTVFVPLNQSWSFVVSGVEIEGDDNHGVDVQYPWEDHPQREHSQKISVGNFYMDKFPVTIGNYSEYLSATGFKPADPYRWLLNWKGSRTPPEALLDKPVTYVSLDEARAYCAWKGARLPREHEWQYAAQGNDGRTYPWGNDKDQSKYPKMQDGNVYQGPESVTAHAPAGASPFGLMDMVGNVWQYTDEFQDDHTRSVVLRGSSNYRPTGSLWYFPQALELGSHEKYFLMDARYERAGTIGFRCVFDAK